MNAVKHHWISAIRRPRRQTELPARKSCLQSVQARMTCAEAVSEPRLEHSAGLHVELVALMAFVEDAEAIGFFDGYFGGRSWCFGPAAAMS